MAAGSLTLRPQTGEIIVAGEAVRYPELVKALSFAGPKEARRVLTTFLSRSRQLPKRPGSRSPYNVLRIRLAEISGVTSGAGRDSRKPRPGCPRRSRRSQRSQTSRTTRGSPGRPTPPEDNEHDLIGGAL